MHNSTPLSALRSLLLAQGLDGMIVPRADAHQSEDCTPHDNKLAWLTVLAVPRVLHWYFAIAR